MTHPYDNKAAKLRSQQRSRCSKGTGDASPSKQFLRIRPVGGSAKMREPVQVSTACHFVTGTFPASDTNTVYQFISRGLSGNRRSSVFCILKLDWRQIMTGFWMDSSGRGAPQLGKQGKAVPLWRFVKFLLRTIFVNHLLGEHPNPLERCLTAAAVSSFQWLLWHQILNFWFWSMK